MVSLTDSTLSGQGLSPWLGSLFELFFCKKKYLLIGVSCMLCTGQWISESVSE